MNHELMILFQNDKTICELFLTNPVVNCALRYCEDNKLLLQEALVEIIKVLAEENKNLQDQLEDVTINSCRTLILK